MVIIGITGTFGAGKGAIVDYLVRKKGFTHYSMRQFLTAELVKLGRPTKREDMLDLANELRREHGPGYLVERILAEVLAKGDHAIIESIRCVGEIDALKKAPKTVVIAVDADAKKRYQRIQKRKSSTDHISFEKFVEDERRESVSDEPWALNLKKCRERAEFIIENNAGLSDLYNQIDSLLEKLNL